MKDLWHHLRERYVRLAMLYAVGFRLKTLYLWRVQDGQFSEEKGFILSDIENENSMPDPWVTERALYRRAIFPCWWLCIKYASSTKTFIFISYTHVCPKMANCEKFRTKCCVKIEAMFTFRYHRYLFDKNVTMVHQEGNLNVLKKMFFPLVTEVKFCDLMSLLFKINKACCINKCLHSFVYLLVIYEISCHIP